MNMGQSGTRLVVAIGGLALALGVVSWWYRFESAHRATQFWGPAAAELIAERSDVLGLKLELAPEPVDGVPSGDWISLSPHDYETPLRKDLTDAPGMVHLRHALLTDSNYLWMKRPEVPDTWRWVLRFSQGDRYVLILLSDDLARLGKSMNSSPIEMISCQPMTATLREYFVALGLK